MGGRAAFWWRAGIVLAGALGLTFRDHSLVYFTVQSNLIVLAYYGGALYWMRRRGVSDAPAPRLRDAATFWIVVTGLVSHILLEKWANPFPGLVSGPDLFGEWATFAVHYVVPVMVLVDWLVFPPHRRCTFRALGLWLAYPLGYALVALLRAALDPEFPIPYPYFFLDVGAHGYPWVAGQIALLALEFAVLASLLVGLSRLRARVAERRRAGAPDAEDGATGRPLVAGTASQG